MLVCMGAPNYVRGGSHCGNLSCVDAIQEDMVDMICPDYHFPTMLTSALMMIRDGLSPSRAINFVSLNPARILDMNSSIGSIEIGKEADLVSFCDRGNFADVGNVWVRGVRKFQASAEGIGQPVLSAV